MTTAQVAPSRTTLRIGELAETVGIETDTIRFYEREGILPAPRRTPSGYRIYDETAIDRLHFVQGAQRLGLKLAEIRDLLEIRDTGTCTCEPAADLLAKRLEEIDAELRRLEGLRQQIATMLTTLPSEACAPPTPGTWCPPTPTHSCDCSEGGDCCEGS